ncbi:MAG: immunoglobulin domain-containing protein, partial [Limisphaerales bacterium]
NYLEHTWLYHNNGDGTFTAVATPFVDMQLSSADWADFNNDGLPDLALNGRLTPWWDSGWSETVIYRNDGNGHFTQIASMGAFNEGCVRWGDYDNDGKVDLLITEGQFNSVYHNNGDETFSYVATSMLGAGDNDAAWIDYNGDGFLDIFIAGETYADSYGSKLYRNQGGGVFTNSGNSIAGFSTGGVAWGDFNNDGTPDLVLTGTMNGTASSAIYRNDAGVLTNVAGSLPGFQRSAAAAAGDFNNDGKLDLFLAGYDGGFNRASQIFRGLGDMTFTGAQFPMLGLINGYAAWGDYDNDGALDLITIGETAGDIPITKLYHNEGAMPDTPPTVPGGLHVTLGNNSALLTWNAATDAEQSGGLTYNVRIGTNANGVTILSPLADLNTGFRRVPKFGNAGYRTSLLITNLAGGSYFWSVQAIDNSFVGSTFAGEQSFTLPAPVITTQPTNLVVHAGSSASFSVGAAGAATLVYQWQFNGSNIAGATDSVFAIASAGLTDQGSYSVTVMNQFGSVTSANVSLTVLTPVSLTQQPQSRTNAVGSWPVFSVNVTGTPPFVYQWFFNGAPLVNDRAFGAQSNILTIASALRGDAGSYFVVVSNNYGTLTSDVVSLAVTAPDVLWNVDFGSGSTSLKTGPAAIGQTASDFWNSYGFNRAGVTNLLLADGTPSAVTVKVYGQGPVAPVNGNPDPMYHDYLYQYNLPGNLTVDTTNLPPGSFDFYYYAGCGDYNYQLYVNGVSQGQWQVWGSGSGSTNWQEGVHYAAFRGVTLTNYTSSVRVVITYLDSVCLEAVISGMQIAEATTAPLFVLQPTNTAVVSGFDATFTAGAIGSPQPVSYQWLFNGTPLTNSAHIAGANSYSLSIFAAQTNDIGSYQLLASTSSNSALSDVAMLWVQSLPPSFTLLPVGQVVAPGSNFVLSVKAVGSIPISYQWFSNGLAMVDDGRIVGATSTNLSFSPAQTNDSASYYVVASNPVNATTSSVANIFVGVAAKISQQPTSQTNIVGTIANFSATVDGTQPLTYSWLFNGAPLSDSARIFGSATSSLSISNVQVTDGGTYVLVAGNGAGTVTSSSVILTVLPPPTISPQPIGRSLPLGLPTTFSVSATGPAPITYQWQINGANIPGATSTAYAISNVSLADLGTYNLVASNVAGVTVSSNAVLTLGPVACWGRNNANQCLPPPGLTNVVGIGGAANYSAGLKSDGTISAWGANFSLLPMSNVVAV